MSMVNSDDQSMTAGILGHVQALGASFKQFFRRHFPVAAAFAEASFIGCERLGERASRSRAGWIGMFAIPMLLLIVQPAAGQVNCNQGMLKFLSDIQTLTVESVGILLLVILIVASALKAAPVKGTDTWANSLIGGFLGGVAFFVLGPALIDLADAATPVDLSSTCNTGGGKQ